MDTPIFTFSRPPSTPLPLIFFHFEQIRLATFRTWPSTSPVKPKKLSETGFYYTGIEDKVRCAFCGIEVYGWESGDEPIKEHKRLQTQVFCPLLNDVNFVSNSSESSNIFYLNYFGTCGNVPLYVNPLDLPLQYWLKPRMIKTYQTFNLLERRQQRSKDYPCSASGSSLPENKASSSSVSSPFLSSSTSTSTTSTSTTMSTIKSQEENIGKDIYNDFNISSPHFQKQYQNILDNYCKKFEKKE